MEDLLKLMYSDTDFTKSIEIAKTHEKENGGYVTNIDEFLLRHQGVLSLSPEDRKALIDWIGRPMSLTECIKMMEHKP